MHDLCVAFLDCDIERTHFVELIEFLIWVCACVEENTHHFNVLSLDRNTEWRFFVELLSVHHVGIRASVQQNLDDLCISKSNRIGEVSSYSKVRIDLGVRVSASRNELPKQICSTGTDREAKGRLVVELLSVHHVGIRASVQQNLDDLCISKSNCIGEVGSYSKVRIDLGVRVSASRNELPKQICSTGTDREAKGRLVVELLSVHHVGIRASVQQNLDDLCISESNCIGEVSSYSERGIDLDARVCPCSNEYPNNLSILLPDGKTEGRLFVRVCVTDGVQVSRTFFR